MFIRACALSLFHTQIFLAQQATPILPRESDPWGHYSTLQRTPSAYVDPLKGAQCSGGNEAQTQKRKEGFPNPIVSNQIKNGGDPMRGQKRRGPNEGTGQMPMSPND
jgi:hypothetical protein